MLSKFLDQIKSKVEPLKKKLPFLSKSDDYDDDEYDDGQDQETGQGVPQLSPLLEVVVRFCPLFVCQ